MQTCLETTAIEKRAETLVRNDYGKNDEYSILHPDALSDGDALGKGTGKVGHMHSIPNCNRPKAINYSDFDTQNGGGLYDIEGRNGVGGRRFLQTISLYGPENEYGRNSVDTSANRSDGQIVVNVL